MEIFQFPSSQRYYSLLVAPSETKSLVFEILIIEDINSGLMADEIDHPSMTYPMLYAPYLLIGEYKDTTGQTFMNALVMSLYNRKIFSCNR